MEAGEATLFPQQDSLEYEAMDKLVAEFLE